jgi:hypothetical protein
MWRHPFTTPKKSLQRKGNDYQASVLPQCEVITIQVMTPLPEELNADGVKLYQEHIGALRWAVEIGRLDFFFGSCIAFVSPCFAS